MVAAGASTSGFREGVNTFNCKCANCAVCEVGNCHAERGTDKGAAARADRIRRGQVERFAFLDVIFHGFKAKESEWSGSCSSAEEAAIVLNGSAEVKAGQQLNAVRIALLIGGHCGAFLAGQIAVDDALNRAR